MTIPLWCLLGFTAWTILIVFGIATWRSALVLRRQKRANEFTGGVQHGSVAYWRVNRAHINAAENLPLLAAVVLTATLAGVRGPMMDVFAEVHLGARVVQTVAHVASNAVPAVMVRFTAMLLQLVCLIGMMVEIARHAL